MIASRQAGMAEVATNVLHNVGNILNSVNISASLVTERVKQSKAPGLIRVAALLQEKGAAVGDFIANDERGKRIPEYLTSLGEQLLGDQKMALEELASLRDNLEHIKDTVAMQQSYAKLCGVTETVAVADLVEDSLRLNAGAFVRHGVTLRREFGEVPPITVDKHKVLQILVNLVRNAKYACDESGRTDKLITLRIEKAPAGVRICVIDNGVGIPAENMSRIFTHGFTTRADGHGFGLHSGALAAQELGGSLRVTATGRAAAPPSPSSCPAMRRRPPMSRRRSACQSAHSDHRRQLGHSSGLSQGLGRPGRAFRASRARCAGGESVRRSAWSQRRARTSRSTPRIRGRKAWRWRARRSPKDGPTPWPSSTCACRRAGTASRPSSTCGRRTPTCRSSICSAHTDYDWTEVVERLGHSDKLLVLRKPAEPIEVLQCATALTRKWENDRLVSDQMLRLEEVITTRTRGLEAANQQLRHLATHDALTGLPNRVLLDDRLQQAIAHADRDMRVLRASWSAISTASSSSTIPWDTARAMSCCKRSRAGSSTVVRTADTVARFGGDEFVLIGTSIADRRRCRRPRVPRHGRAAGAGAHRRHRHSYLAQHRHRHVSGRRHHDPGAAGARRRRHVFGQAERPRQRSGAIRPGMHAGTEDRVQLESDLHNAVSAKQFELYYQPKVDTQTGEVRSAEALIRWLHPHARRRSRPRTSSPWPRSAA